MSSYQEVSVSLADGFGSQRTASRIAERTVDVWQHVSDIFTPLFGSGPVALLYELSLRSARARHAWLPGCLDRADRPPNMDLNALRQALAEQAPDAAIEGATLTLYSLCVLLERLVGNRLASLMLQPVFAVPRGRSSDG